MSRRPRLGRCRKTLVLSYLGDSSSLLVIRDIQNWLLSVESSYLVDLIYRYLLLHHLLLEPLLICVFVILLYSLTSRLSLEILFSMILCLLDFHRCNFTGCRKRWSSRPSWNLGNDLFLRRLACWSLEWTWLCQFLSAWGFHLPLYYVLSLRSRRPSSSWKACEDAPSLKALSLMLLMDKLFLHLCVVCCVKGLGCATDHCKVWLTSIRTSSNHLGVTCFLDLAHWTNSVLFEVTVVTIVEEPFLSYMRYWLIARLLFDQLGNLWLMSHDIRELSSGKRLVSSIFKSLVTPSFVRSEALCLCRLITQLVLTTQHILVHIEIESLFDSDRRLELLCFPIRSNQLILPVLLINNFWICCHNLLDALMTSL